MVVRVPPMRASTTPPQFVRDRLALNTIQPAMVIHTAQATDARESLTPRGRGRGKGRTGVEVDDGLGHAGVGAEAGRNLDELLLLGEGPADEREDPERHALQRVGGGGAALPQRDDRRCATGRSVKVLLGCGSRWWEWGGGRAHRRGRQT